MKKILKIIPFVIAIFITVMVTHAYYSTSKTMPSIFETDGYVFKLNASGGYFEKNDSIYVVNGSTTLPTPKKNGYSFLGYSNSSNGEVNYSISINDVKQIDDKEIYAKWKVNTYSISYNLNGGQISGNKTTYNVEDNFTLPIPTRTGYTFQGWTGSNGNTPQTSITIPKGTTNNLSYTANWSINTFVVDVNPIIQGTTYNSGLEGYTFSVWLNGNLVAENVTDYYNGSINYGSTLRVYVNDKTGYSVTSFRDNTWTVTSSFNINPSWGVNTYESHFYLNGVHRLTTYNTYGAYISTPNTSASALGYDGNFYYISSYSPWTTWYQPDYAVGFTINISEYNCMASFGSAGSNNANYQLKKLQAAGYNFCTVNSGWGALECSGNYSKVINLYNNAWNILPRSGSGYSIYKQISCDSGWSNVQRR